MIYKSCKLWKITLESALEDYPEALTFWAYNLNEKSASASSIRWADEVHPEGNYLVTKVDLLS